MKINSTQTTALLNQVLREGSIMVAMAQDVNSKEYINRLNSIRNTNNYTFKNAFSITTHNYLKNATTISRWVRIELKEEKNNEI